MYDMNNRYMFRRSTPSHATYPSPVCPIPPSINTPLFPPLLKISTFDLLKKHTACAGPRDQRRVLDLEMASWTRSLRSRAASIDSSDEKAHGPLPNSAAAMASNDRGSSGTTSNIYATLRRSSQRKRPRQSVGDQGAPARKGSKSKELLSAQLLENVRGWIKARRLMTLAFR